MYEIKLIFKNHKQHTPSLMYKESITHCATIDLFLRGIHTSQTSATRIVFETERDRMLGMLILSNSDKFTVQCVDNSSQQL